ncbi:hypothetical protein LFWB_0490 [Candidatus Phytoplasma luffae]|uniref:Uncharacterized protein n=1 Tax=Loofah witches'-broom phytoplasma TaxID=35773 RepID=A0A975FIN8_LOWBP|nr:hypothetical protein [Candidatus Phytoplasma luffae]QTX02619.1 hypothetical protein LFWB_0490 [Candidatus Phytoplasma luffae]
MYKNNYPQSKKNKKKLIIIFSIIILIIVAEIIIKLFFFSKTKEVKDYQCQINKIFYRSDEQINHIDVYDSQTKK